jgi:sialidase-1
MRTLTPLLLLAIIAILIPATSLADDIQKQVLWKSQTDGYHTYRIPSLITAADGTLLAFCEGRRGGQGDAGAIDLLMKSSSDNGQTWSPQQVVWKDADNTCGNPCPVLDRSTGRLHLLMTFNLGTDTESKIIARTAESSRTVWRSFSDDHGKTWSKPVDITSQTKRPDWTWYATGPGIGIQIEHGPHKGRLVIPCDHAYDVSKEANKRGWEFGSHVIYSDDHGDTWNISEPLAPGMNECQVVEIGNDSSLILDMRSYRGKGCRAQAISKDGGQTWSEIKDVDALVSPVCQASILRVSWPTSANLGLIVFAAPRHESKRVNLTLVTSSNDGQSWDGTIALYEGPSAYSSLAVLANSNLACLAEVGEKNPYETITLFTLSDVKRRLYSAE